MGGCLAQPSDPRRNLFEWPLNLSIATNTSLDDRSSVHGSMGLVLCVEDIPNFYSEATVGSRLVAMAVYVL